MSESKLVNCLPFQQPEFPVVDTIGLFWPALSTPWSDLAELSPSVTRLPVFSIDAHLRRHFGRRHVLPDIGLTRSKKNEISCNSPRFSFLMSMTAQHASVGPGANGLGNW